MIGRLLVPRGVLAEIGGYVTGQLPMESGGILLGHTVGGDRVALEFAALHSAARARNRYQAAAAESVAAVYRAARTAQDIVATVHSHPIGEGLPSPTDLLEAFGYRSCWHVIVSFAQGEAVFGVFEYHNERAARSYSRVSLDIV